MGVSGTRTRWRLVEIAGMQVGQRLFVIEPVGLGNKAFDQLQDAVGAIGKALAEAPCRRRLRAICPS